MKHVSAIRKQIETGQTEDALNALENLLTLGPSNTGAIKLQASIFHSQGRFAEEHKLWQRVLQIDRQDEDAINYFLRQQQEDREHFYFTDELADGGRRFIVYPKGLVNTSAVGLVGCLSFLIFSRIASGSPIFQNDHFVLAIFLMLVIAPWIGIAATFLTSLRHVDVTPTHIEINTRLKRHRYRWDDLEGIEIAMRNPLDEDTLQMVIHSKNKDDLQLCIDLSSRTSAIRARNYFVREVSKSFPGLLYVSSKISEPSLKRMLRL